MKLRTERILEWVKVKRGSEEAKFQIEPLTPKDNQELLRQATEITWERNQRVEQLDWYEYKRLKIIKIIKEWEGIEDAEGNALPCTPSNKEIVFLYNTSIIDDAIDKADALAGSFTKLEKEMTKNLSSGHGGKGKRE